MPKEVQAGFWWNSDQSKIYFRKGNFIHSADWKLQSKFQMLEKLPDHLIPTSDLSRHFSFWEESGQSHLVTVTKIDKESRYKATWMKKVQGSWGPVKQFELMGCEPQMDGQIPDMKIDCDVSRGLPKSFRINEPPTFGLVRLANEVVQTKGTRRSPSELPRLNWEKLFSQHKVSAVFGIVEYLIYEEVMVIGPIEIKNTSTGQLWHLGGDFNSLAINERYVLVTSTELSSNQKSYLFDMKHQKLVHTFGESERPMGFTKMN